MQSFKNLFFHNDRQQRWLFRYLFFIFVFISFFVSEIDPVIGNDIIFFLEAIFIYFFFRKFGFKSDFSASYQRNKTIYIIFILWLIGSFISLIFSPILINLHAFLAQVPRFFATITSVFFGYSLYHFFRKSSINPWLFFFIIGFGAVLTGLNFLIVWNVYPITRVDPNFLLNPPFYINIRQAGFHANAAVCILVGFLFSTYLSRNTQFILYVLLTGMWTYLFWTGGRASALAAVFSVYFLLFILFAFRQKVTLFVFSIGITIVLGILLSEYLSVLPINGILNNIDRNMVGDVNRFSSGRVEIWKNTLLALEHHWIFGLGAESYMFLRDVNGELLFSTQPHNVVLQFLVEWGVFGLIMSFGFLGGLFYKGLKNNLRNLNSEQVPLKIVSVLIILSFSISGLVDGTFYHAQTVMCLVLSFVVWLMPNQPPKEAVSIS